MSQLCAWSEERLSRRHPRYAKIFRRLAVRGPEGRETDAVFSDSGEEVFERQIRTPVTPRTPRHLRASPPSPRLPAPPKPSADKALHQVEAEEATKEGSRRSSTTPIGGDVDIWGIKPVEAVNFLCAYVEILIKEARRKPHKPLSPPVSDESSANTSRNATPASVSSPFSKPSDKDMDPLSSSRQAGATTSPAPRSRAPPPELVVSPASSSPDSSHFMRVPRSSRTPIDSPVSNPRTPIHSLPPSPRLPHIVVTEADKKVQSSHLSKRFFCKSVPNVSLAAYLGRIHKYCYMATAVYLAAGMYIEKLSQTGTCWTVLSQVSDSSKAIDSYGSDEDPIVELTPRSVHRLLLAALRVANKALSDLYWPHKRVADVGGVSQLELQRLEVSMCYLCDFKLQVTLGDLEAFVRRARAIGVVDASVAEE